MHNEDLNHTTSWDGGQVRQAANTGGQRQEPPSPAGRRTGKKKKKQRTNPLLAIILWVAIVLASSSIFAGVGWMLANDFAALNKTYKEVNFEVKEEWIARAEEEEQSNGEKKEVTYYDMAQVAKALEEDGLIEYGWFFRLFCWVSHADAKITQGTFTLNTNMDYMALVRNMRSRGGSAVTVDVAIPEGYTVSQIIALLADKGVGTEEDLTDIAENYVFEDYPFVDNENLGTISRLEGYLFPDTYNFYVGARPELAFNSMLKNFKNKVFDNEDLADLFADSDYELSDIITVASMVERETDGTDRDKIASVIYNRLENAGETNYLLQVDAALVYANGGRAVTQEDYTTLDSPYNLYQHTGLPPTPIANPGIASIRAALMPADTDYYFYVLGADDKHVFSETLAEHNAAQEKAAKERAEQTPPAD